MTITETAPTLIGEATIAEFAAGLRGTVVRPGDEDYDLERSIWNGAHDRYPALIARCAGVADAIRTVDLARSEGLPLAVRGGGHSIAGFTTGGGIGWLMRKYGLAADNMVGADVVTADGQYVHASADENPELFWGLRGGGGNFGVVTSFEFELHE